MTAQADEPAFPVVSTELAMNEYNHIYPNVTSVGGLTKRELFAAMALQGMLASSHPYAEQAWQSDAVAAEWSRNLADALLRALEPKPETP